MPTDTRPAVVPPPLVRELSYGMSGEDVKYVQTILQKEGFFSGTPLGNFKKLTKEAVLHFQNTHIGEDGKELKADAEVGKKTWWALHNPHGDAQRNFIPVEAGAVLARAEDGPRHKVLKKLYAMYAQGIKEIPDGSNYGDGVTPICNACGFTYGIYWCLAAQAYAIKEALGTPPLGAMHVHCSTFWNEALKLGFAFPKGSYTPTPGDIAIYNYGRGLLSSGRLDGAGHAAAMVRLSVDGQQFNALEGNIGNRFKHSIRNMSERTLVGFVNPYKDAANLPKFERGITQAPTIAASYADSR
jgi:peptidoglycan hydrolase-like protein with peptidoglycan-binding domain